MLHHFFKSYEKNEFRARTQEVKKMTNNAKVQITEKGRVGRHWI